MSVGVEIYRAGDGINYPKPKKHVVTIHYVGFVRARLAIQPPAHVCMTVALHLYSVLVTAPSLTPLATGASRSSSSSAQSKSFKVLCNRADPPCLRWRVTLCCV